MKKAEPVQTRPTNSWIEKRANLLRRDAAQALGTTHVARPLQSTHWATYVEHLPLSRGSLEFNEEVTLRALNAVLAEDDPYLVAFLGSKVVERTFYDIYQADSSLKPVRNLIVAKRFGVFFTPPAVALRMAAQSKGEVVLDPCCGAGALLAACMLEPLEGHPELHGTELDPFTNFCASQILKRVKELTQYRGRVSVNTGDGLHVLLAALEKPCTQTHVLINPPYGRLRVTRASLTNAETALIDGDYSRQHALRYQMNEDVRRLRMLFPSESGLLELSRLFFRLCAEISYRGGSATIISPDAWLSNRDAVELRAFLIKERLIESVFLIREDKGEFSTVNQALAVTAISGQRNAEFYLSRLGEPSSAVILYDSLRGREHSALPKIAGPAASLYQKLGSNPRLKELSWIKNARGELDQTAAKHAFVESKTAIPLIRGEHVGRFSVVHSSSSAKPSFVDEEVFRREFSGKPKGQDFLRARIVGRQCSYAQQGRRLIFGRIPEGYAVGNSCNYLSVNVVDGEIKLTELLAVLNSAVSDWFFRVENSNNHVANYEIDSLPMPLEERWMPLICACVEALERRDTSHTSEPDWRQDLLEAAVALAYGLEEDEIKFILSEIGDCDHVRVLNYARQLRSLSSKLKPGMRDGFFNNQEPTLSALDRLIISHVPPGGNWQNIPETVPSERIKQIREMSAERGVVRTTYYGRLRAEQPCYTINTYFNRPGNGTHIHPVLDRTLTSREAARLQSFPDSFLFCGSETAIRNQIGNAVPPLLAYAIGQKFIPYSVDKTCIDMFCGAGGFSLGLERAGWSVVAAVDNDKEALDTFSINHRNCVRNTQVCAQDQTAVLQRDLSDGLGFESLLGELQAVLNGRSLDLLVGGPPCQGFSHAGFRQIGDARNDLASLYLHFAEKLRPKIFILENVEGLATFEGGKVMADICLTLKELGYRVHQPVWKLNAEQYGVAQMRRRVFVVATIDDNVDLAPPLVTHAKCEGRRSDRYDLFESSLRVPYTVADALAGLSMPRSATATDLFRWLTS